MQIHEIVRRPVNEGILKGVAKAPLNTAEYFANKILDTAGVPAAQQGTYSKYGHMAASQNKGTASIAKAENEIATEIAKEWARLGTVNNVKDETLDPKNIEASANSLNTGKLQINPNNIVAIVQKMAPEYRRLQDLYTKNPKALAPAVKPANAQPSPANAQPSPAPAPAQAPAGFNYTNVMKMPGMTAPVKKPVAAPAAPAVPAAPAPTRSTANLRATAPGLPSGTEWANFEKKFKDAMAAQGQTA
jgi:hypothetical protein